MDDLKGPMLSYYVIYYEKFTKVHKSDAVNIEGSFNVMFY